MSPTRSVSRIPLLGRNAAAQRLVQERTWLLEQRVAELERERKDLGRILRGLGEGVVAVDRAGVVVHANPAAVRLLGLEAQCLGSHMFVAVPHPGLCDVLEDVMRGGEGGRLVRELAIERPEGDAVLVDGELVRFTRTELRLLHVLLRRPGRVYTREQLVERVMGDNAWITDRTIDVHVRAIRRKLGERAGVVETIRGVGYRGSDALVP
jgi:PAS domain-containing protein